MSLFYCFKLVTTIGYGSIVPTTNAGKLLSIVYAFFGIILLVTFLVNIGSFLANRLTSFYNRIIRKSKRSGSGYERQNFDDDNLSADDDNLGTPRPEDAAATEEDDPQVVDIKIENHEDIENHEASIPFLVIFIFSVTFLLIFSALIFALEDWSYIDSIYYSFMSLATVGFGDIIPEKNLLGCIILLANAFIVVSTLVCLGRASVMRILMSAQRCVDKIISRFA
ncbi:TWiK family of potassium channels protein 18-like [Antedon mediterranea]|uniref:TWiK family of potassium channels protein 18-like n=1 Tax=Antedon mediterranea TaxID=105859 RepID=UPI003AF6A3BB